MEYTPFLQKGCVINIRMNNPNNTAILFERDYNGRLCGNHSLYLSPNGGFRKDSFEITDIQIDGTNNRKVIVVYE